MRRTNSRIRVAIQTKNDSGANRAPVRDRRQAGLRHAGPPFCGGPIGQKNPCPKAGNQANNFFVFDLKRRWKHTRILAASLPHTRPSWPPSVSIILLRVVLRVRRESDPDSTVRVDPPVSDPEPAALRGPDTLSSEVPASRAPGATAQPPHVSIRAAIMTIVFFITRCL